MHCISLVHLENRQTVIYRHIREKGRGKNWKGHRRNSKKHRLLLTLKYRGKALTIQRQLKSLLFSSISRSTGCFFLFHPSLPCTFLKEMSPTMICPRRLFQCYLFAILSKKGKIHYKESESTLRSEACSSGVEGVSENNRTNNPRPRNVEELLSTLEAGT